MIRKEKIERNLNPPSKSRKPKGPVTLGGKKFIDEIIRKVESQASVGPSIIYENSPTIIPQAAGSPDATYAEIHNEKKDSEQSFQIMEHINIDPSEEGNSCNLHEGEGETSGVVEINLKSLEPKSPKILVDKEKPNILDYGSTVRHFPKLTSSPARTILPDQEIPKGYWNIFDSMLHN